MSEKLFNALEICLQVLEQGDDIDAALTRFPDLAAELRPILEASLNARQLAGSAVSDEAQRRGRARLLQRAVELRESKRAPRRTWIFTLRPVAVVLMLAFFFLSGTGLVRASSTSLPGDNLYPVKRTWEDVRLLFVSTDEERDFLELEYENERLEEVNELLVHGRTETVSFIGYVTNQSDGQWTVAGVPVTVSGETNLPKESITVGMAVTVIGQTNSQGYLAAQSIEPVEPGTIVPELEDQDNDNDADDIGGGIAPGEDNDNDARPGPGSGDDSDGSDKDTDSDKKNKLQGKVESMNGNVWVVNGKPVDVSVAEIVGTPSSGAQVVVEGYYDANGVFIATRVIFTTDGDGYSGSSDGNENEDESDDDTDNDNDNEDEDSNDNDDNENDNTSDDS